MSSIAISASNNSTPVAFSFQESHEVRIQVIGDEPWFCLKDVCSVLEIKNASQLAGQLDEKGICKTYTPTKGGKQQLVYVNEPNLYRVIFRSNKPEARQFQDWVFNDVLPSIRKKGNYQHQKGEPISNKDMENIKNLVWMMTHNMKFSESWNYGVWRSLRAATGTPSPQRFAVEDLPALKEECTRILRITTAVNKIMFEFEKSVISKVLRRNADIQPLVDKMNSELLQIESKERDGLLMLEKVDEFHLKTLTTKH
ncbi:BRO-N domain-containing protein [Pectobacterium odoriferum]|uniref:BRO-N domain-containing protein n=1 Tax=Pectobacterium odoriferum TaxID=78398 RepID=UPI000691C255|nr:BRO family protein [Pectobacterium odoriferum]